MTRGYPDRSQPAVAERRDQVRRLTLAGYSAREIAVRLGITRYAVIRHRKRSGVGRPPAPRLTDEQVEAAARLVTDGAPIAEVARTVGCSDWAIRQRFPDAAWTHKQRTDYIAALIELDPDYWRARAAKGRRRRDD